MDRGKRGYRHVKLDAETMHLYVGDVCGLFVYCCLKKRALVQRKGICFQLI